MAVPKETHRLDEANDGIRPWKLWGPYLSERQWGTVREDYSKDGNAWDYFSHDQARSKAYRWGEDGIAGISDNQQLLCFSLALWNFKDPILKERMFGLTNSEGNHGEDVKEYYFYLDNTPTHSYMKYLYKYPQNAYPYDNLVQTNRGRSRMDHEYELVDTGVFSENRYFDVLIEYAKADPKDMLINITVSNRGPAKVPILLAPTLWFRNTWSSDGTGKPHMEKLKNGFPGVLANHPQLGSYVLLCDGETEILFTENETNEKYYSDPKWQGYAKDAFHRYLIHNEKSAVNPEEHGTKSASVSYLYVPANQSVRMRLRLKQDASASLSAFDDFDSILQQRRQEANEFFASITPPKLSADQQNVMRQALAGMLWTKQFYFLDNDRWLSEHGGQAQRNVEWSHVLNSDVISMPDKWEYPWYAAWDLAFHTIPLAMVDIEFAKRQLNLIFSDVYLHGNGQVPAYEWNFSDVNPPVHAWAALRLSELEFAQTGKRDVLFLRSVYHKLLLNFTWWLNRKDARGRNLFEGGFLGLDNIGIFDRSKPLPGGGYLDQADGTAWMALYSQNMLQLAIELTREDPTYSEMATKFVEHFLRIAAAMDRLGPSGDSMWNDEDGFFYDVLRSPDGTSTPLRLRSIVGLLPLCASTVIENADSDMNPEARQRIRRFIARHPELIENIALPTKPGYMNRHLLAIVNEGRLRRILRRMLDEEEFWGPYGIRSISKFYEDHPYSINIGGTGYVVKYLPAESDSGMFGGNSNWRGPVWFPVNVMILRALHQLYLYYGNEFKVECPTGSGNMLNLLEVGIQLGERLNSIFLRDSSGHRPVFGGNTYFNEDPFWRDLVPFHEYFHGDNGAGIGASHQTGWTGFVAKLIQLQGSLVKEEILRSPEIPDMFVKKVA
jgi:hypothetical protein